MSELTLRLGLQSHAEGLQEYLERMTKLIDDAQADYSKVGCAHCWAAQQASLAEQSFEGGLVQVNKKKRTRPALRSQSKLTALPEGPESPASCSSRSLTPGSSACQGSTTSTGAAGEHQQGGLSPTHACCTLQSVQSVHHIWHTSFIKTTEAVHWFMHITLTYLTAAAGHDLHRQLEVVQTWRRLQAAAAAA